MSEPNEVGADSQFSNENVVHFVASDEDEDVEVDTTIRPATHVAFPPKTDELRETPLDELMALRNAMNAYKRTRGLSYLTWDDVLDVIHDLGYRKVAAPADAAKS
jgi:hypothetical protein